MAALRPAMSRFPGTGPRRIAVVAASLEILGGQGVQAQALVAGLRNDGFDVDFVPINPSFPPGLRWLRRLRGARTVVNQTLYAPSLYRLRRADVVHVFSASYLSFLISPTPAMLAARLFRKPIILHYHSGEAADHLAKWGVLVHPLLRLADEIVVPSPYLQRVFARFGYSASVVRNVVDTEQFRFRSDTRDPLRPCLLSIRNLERHYRVDVVIEAFADVKRRHPGATLVVAGYGSEATRLKALTRRLRLDDVRFLGRVEPERVPELYKDADIFVNAAEVDNQPVSILEAFAAGVPVVSTDVGDVRTMLQDGKAGVIVPPGDPTALANAVDALLCDPDRIRSMTHHARSEIERYSWPSVGSEWASIYHRCMLT